jgi:hypothetical protein
VEGADQPCHLHDARGSLTRDRQRRRRTILHCLVVLPHDRSITLHTFYGPPQQPIFRIENTEKDQHLKLMLDTMNAGRFSQPKSTSSTAISISPWVARSHRTLTTPSSSASTLSSAPTHSSAPLTSTSLRLPGRHVPIDCASNNTTKPPSGTPQRAVQYPPNMDAGH